MSDPISITSPAAPILPKVTPPNVPTTAPLGLNAARPFPPMVPGQQARNMGEIGKMPSKQPTVDPHLHKVAQQFEAVFMSEMLRQARPPDKTAKQFSTGQSGDTWQFFMDQALGEAAAKGDRGGLTREIEKALQRTQGQKR